MVSEIVGAGLLAGGVFAAYELLNKNKETQPLNRLFGGGGASNGLGNLDTTTTTEIPVPNVTNYTYNIAAPDLSKFQPFQKKTSSSSSAHSTHRFTTQEAHTISNQSLFGIKPKPQKDYSSIFVDKPKTTPAPDYMQGFLQLQQNTNNINNNKTTKKSVASSDAKVKKKKKTDETVIKIFQ